MRTDRDRLGWIAHNIGLAGWVAVLDDFYISNWPIGITKRFLSCVNRQMTKEKSRPNNPLR